jgi:2-aminobenzoate-CoA ligase
VQKIVIARATFREVRDARRKVPPPIWTPSPATTCRRATSGRTCLLDRFEYPARLNAAVELTDRMVERGFGDHTALIGNGRRRTYKELADWTNRIAHALAEDYGVKPGHRVLIRSANNPAMVAAWLGATKAGAVVINTMPMLRAGELAKIVDKAKVSLALCDTRLMEELVTCAKDSATLKQVVGFDGTANHDAELDRIALNKSVRFTAVDTAQDDVALMGFTSGTTGEPKATMHFHRDLLIIADGYAREVLGVTPDDVFVGSPPLGLHLRARRARGLSAALRGGGGAAGERLAAEHDRHHPDLQGDDLLHRADRLSGDAEGDGRGRGPVVPALRGLGGRDAAGAGLRGMAGQDRQADARRDRRDRDAAHLHLEPAGRFAPACTGRPVTGYEAKDRRRGHERGAARRDRPAGRARADRLPLSRGPAAEDLCQGGWNLTGDSFYQDDRGLFPLRRALDDMIVSAGYNIAGPEVEAALLSHPAVLECGVIGAPDEERGQIVEAHVVLAPASRATRRWCGCCRTT